MHANDTAALTAAIRQFTADIDLELAEVNTTSKDHNSACANDVLTALCTRQARLTKQLATTPSLWNDHVGLLVLRTITELHITVAWLRRDPTDRAHRFVAGSLHAVQVELEERYRELGLRAPTSDERAMLDGQERWIANQEMALHSTGVAITPLPPVDRLAEEAGCSDYHRSVYAPFDGYARSLWHHVERQSDAAVPDADLSYLLMASRYWIMTVQLFCAVGGTGATAQSSRDRLVSALSWIID